MNKPLKTAFNQQPMSNRPLIDLDEHFALKDIIFS